MSKKKINFSLSGAQAAAIVVCLVLIGFGGWSVFGVSPEKVENLQAKLRDDIQRYLLSAHTVQNAQALEASLKSRALSADPKLLQTSFEQALNPEIVSIDLKRSMSNSYCEDDSQFNVLVNYQNNKQNRQVELRYCLRNNRSWTRASPYLIQ